MDKKGSMDKIVEFKCYDSNGRLLLENIQENEWVDAEVFFDALEKEVESWYK